MELNSKDQETQFRLFTTCEIGCDCAATSIRNEWTKDIKRKYRGLTKGKG